MVEGRRRQTKLPWQVDVRRGFPDVRGKSCLVKTSSEDDLAESRRLSRGFMQHELVGWLAGEAMRERDREGETHNIMAYLKRTVHSVHTGCSETHI